MFTGHHAHPAHLHYHMEKVPLRIGVKIRPDDKFYDSIAIESYKQAS